MSAAAGSVGEIKALLANAYGIKDTSDCLEKSDLERKLEHVRRTEPITRGHKYGRLEVVGNTKNPSAIVTLSHGLGDSCDGWVDVARDYAGRLKHVLFLVPTAPKRRITINGGQAMNGWYDIVTFDRSPTAPQDSAVIDSAEYVYSLAGVYANKYGVDASRLVFAGFSQGAAISIAAGLIAPVPPAAVVAISGYLASEKHVLPALRNKAVTIFMAHGTEDPLIPLEVARVSKKALESAGVAGITLKEYKVGHSVVPEELDEIAKFIGTVLPA